MAATNATLWRLAISTVSEKVVVYEHEQDLRVALDAWKKWRSSGSRSDYAVLQVTGFSRRDGTGKIEALISVPDILTITLREIQ